MAQLRQSRFYYSAAEAFLSAVEHHVLARGHRTLRLVETNLATAVGQHGHGAGLIQLPVAHFGSAIETLGRRMPGDPA